MTRREEIEQQAKSYTLTVFDELDDFSDVTQAYIDGAELADKTMIDKACEWLQREVADDYKGVIWDNMVSDFRKAMEE